MRVRVKRLNRLTDACRVASLRRACQTVTRVGRFVAAYGRVGRVVVVTRYAARLVGSASVTGARRVVGSRYPLAFCFVGCVGIVGATTRAVRRVLASAR